MAFEGLEGFLKRFLGRPTQSEPPNQGQLRARLGELQKSEEEIRGYLNVPDNLASTKADDVRRLEEIRGKKAALETQMRSTGGQAPSVEQTQVPATQPGTLTHTKVIEPTPSIEPPNPSKK